MEREDRLRRWVEALCAEDMAGREAGSVEGRRARDFIAAELRAAGLSPQMQPVPGCGGDNVIARVPGARPGTVLIGAHYDHLGRVPGGGAYWGADDNAAAVALLLELARVLPGSLDASVLLVAFDAEEPPHFLQGSMGSMVFARDPAAPLETIDLMIALDLVGHAIGPDGTPAPVSQSLFVMGAEKSEGTLDLVRRAAVPGLYERPLGIDLVPPLSDYEAFRRASVPFLFLTCGRWRHYHQPTDTPDRLDYGKLARIVSFVEGLVRGCAGRPRFDGEARDHATTIASLRAIAEALPDPRAAAAAQVLAEIGDRLARTGKLPPSDWSTLLGVVALMEQGLA